MKRRTMMNPVQAFKFIYFVRSFAAVFFLVCSLAALNGAASAAVKTVIHLSPETVVTNDRIELGQVSQFTGDLDRAERLKTISLGYAPNVGMSREIGREQITLTIKAAGFTDGDFTIDGAFKIVVRRTGQSVPDSQIRVAIQSALLDRLKADGVTANVSRVDLPSTIAVPMGLVEVRANAAGIRSMFERFAVPIELRVDGRIVRNMAANVEIEVFADVLVAAKNLAANTMLGPADVRFEKRKLEKPVASYLRENERLRGMQLVKNIAAGAPITADLFVPGTVIKFGDAVKVEAGSGRLKIVITCEARSAGKIGDRITVRNPQSGVIMQGIVIGEGLVRVNF